MFFRILLFILIGYFIISFFRKLFAVGSGPRTSSYNKSASKKEGDITVEEPGKKTKGSINKDEGEYIDYEEID